MAIDQIVPLAAQVDPGTGTLTGADQINSGPNRGIKLVIDITAIAGGATVTVTLQGKDPVSGKYFTILASAALAAAATTVLTVFPGATASANVTVNDELPRTWRVTAAVAVAGTVSFAIGAILLD